MQNFDFKNPTRIIFGRGGIARLSDVIPADARILMIYGGGSIKKNGVHDQVMAALEGREVQEFGGIEPNPTYETCMGAVHLCRREGLDYLLAVGGGSVIDATKFIAAAVGFTGDDPWDILRTFGANVESALPFSTVLTLPATGSEANSGSVISKKSSEEKLIFGSPLVFPQVSVLDPATTFSLPTKQVRNGLVDAFAHVCEQYVTSDNGADLQSRLAEGVLHALVTNAPACLAESDNYDARAEFMWSATMALNGLLGKGVTSDWSTHMIGHELTAFYGLDHAETLAVVLPGVWKAQLESKRTKLEQMGERVFGVKGAEAAIAAVEGFFNGLDMPTRLGDHQVDATEAADRIAERFETRGTVLGEEKDLTPARVREIVQSRG